MTREQTVKVQLPLFSSGDPETSSEALPLVYDRHRSHQVLQRVPAIVVGTLAAKGAVKGYFHATWDDGNNVWIIGKQVGSQPW